MFFPFITKRSGLKKLFRRKGGGGRGGGSSGGGSSGGGSSGGGSSGGTRGGGSVPVGGSTGATGRGTATSYGRGGVPVTTIPSGQPFSGRSVGGGTRDQVFGTRTYGSGYPGIAGRGVAGRGFPFLFWPVVWGGGAGLATSAYLHDNEYGDASNTSRPGGPLLQAPFQSATLNTTFHVIADNATLTSLLLSVNSNCTSSLSSASNSTVPQAFDPSQASAPKPEQAVEYYRASSVVLTLDGYNNTAALSNDTSLPDTPLPTGIDTTLLDCLNQTIGLAVPLIDGAVSWRSPGAGVGVVGAVWMVWCLLTMVF
ncbi:hypothetical protein BD410DRAFT_744058 [Rickenella mellea]|uniref:Uncharacterized protein n=1 Tax=Rickenella mellea TaxID=50990 RepID=A0A4Y7QEK6_9AGAM|nr:hypothetical protein BD410DRAFT_744058 [Rickenella mellea]